METWYVMENGSCGDPREVKPNKDGVLHHKDGRAVAYAPHGPRTRSVDPEEEGSKVNKKTRELTSEEPKKKYKTR